MSTENQYDNVEEQLPATAPPATSDATSTDAASPVLPITPPPEAALATIQLDPEQRLSPRQQRALHYLERKRARTRITLSRSDAPPPATSSLPGFSEPYRPALFPDSSRLDLQQRWKRRKKLLNRHLSRRNLRQSRIAQHRTFHRFWLVLGSVVLALLVLFVSLSSTGALIAYRFYNDTQEQYIGRVTTLHDLLPRDNLKVYDSKGVLIGQLLDQGMHTSVPLGKVSPNLVNATVAIEDKNFWTNPGVDLLRIVQAALSNLRSGRVVEGGSTITQQLIKNLVVGNETTIERKLQEVVLTPALNSRYSKSDILEMYLNSIYYGEQAYGIDAAASMYFGLEDKPNKPASLQLSLAQAAMLAGIPNSPDGNDPFLYRAASLARMQVVLDAMVRERYITRVQANDAYKEAQAPGFFKHPASLKNRAPHFFNFVLSQLMSDFHLKRQQLSRSDLKVSTTLDIALQDKIQKIAQTHIATLRDTHHVTNAAEVLIDFHTGAIRSLLGSIDYNNKSIDGQFDVATQGYRQPGSSFKPYVYVTAFAQEGSPAQAVADVPTTLQLPDSIPPTFTPLNYDRRFHGQMTLRCAIQNSLNVPAVRVLKQVGIDAAMQTAKDMGITSYSGTPGYSLVLGGLGVRLLDHTSAFGSFANAGMHVPYYAIEKVVVASTNQTIELQKGASKQAISPQLAYMMTNVLSDNTARLPQFYDCNVLQLYSNSQEACWSGDRGTVRPAAVKTGTTNDFRDNWTVGYTTDYVMGVWVGNNDNSPMFDVTGVQGAAPIWHESMLVAEKGRPVRDFTNPGGLERATVTYADGVRATDWFLPGTVPSVTTFPVLPPTVGPDPFSTPTPTPNPTGPSAPTGGSSYCPSSYTLTSVPPYATSFLPAAW